MQRFDGAFAGARDREQIRNELRACVEAWTPADSQPALARHAGHRANLRVRENVLQAMCGVTMPAAPLLAAILDAATDRATDSDAQILVERALGAPFPVRSRVSVSQHGIQYDRAGCADRNGGAASCSAGGVGPAPRARAGEAAGRPPVVAGSWMTSRTTDFTFL